MPDAAVHEALPAGVYERNWDGLDDRGRQLRPDVYTVRLLAGATHLTQKVAIAK